MAYLVNTTPRAERDLRFIYRRMDFCSWEALDPDALMKEWYRGLKGAILALETNPRRNPLISTLVAGELRHFPYGYSPLICRVFYSVVEDQNRVELLHICHDAPQENPFSEFLWLENIARSLPQKSSLDDGIARQSRR